MSYRNPQFYAHHAFRVAADAALGGSTFSASFPRIRLLDSAISLLAQYNAAAANQYVVADRGAGSLTLLNRLIIPSGHTLAGTTLEVRHKATTPASGTDGTSAFNATVAAGLAVLTLAPSLNLRYILANVPASGAWAFPELWFTSILTTTTGPTNEWQDSLTPNVSRQTLEGGATFRLQKGADRRTFVFNYEGLTGADLTTFTTLRSECGNGLYPFYFDPPDTAEPTLLVELAEPIVFTQDSGWAGSSAGPTYKTKLSLIECLA